MNRTTKIDLRKLQKNHNLQIPFIDSIWIKMHEPLTRKEIREAIQKRCLISPDIPKPMDGLWDISSREQHIQRIAWLVANYQEEHPIEVDFGIPGFCQMAITDGHHRLAAAIYLKLDYILVSASGSTKVIEKYRFKRRKICSTKL